MPASTATDSIRVTAASLAGAVLVALLIASIGAQAARAATIHACVKPKSGATRIVGAKAKCRHDEKKLTWSTTGPRGATGAPGAAGTGGLEGKAGVDGTGPAYAAREESPHVIETETFIVNKVVPPGSYSVFGKLELVAQSEEHVVASAICVLLDSAGTTPTGTGADVDTSIFEEPLAEVKAKEWIYDGTVALEGTFTSKVTSTVSLACGNFGSKVPVSATDSQLQAISVTGIL
jgi:hypothetical protein